MKVVVVGGGVVGCASALALAARGADVVLVERGALGGEASSAAAGILGAQIETHESRTTFASFLRARAAYASWSEQLRDATGVDIGYRVSGALRIVTTEAERADVTRATAWQREWGGRADLVDGAEARAIEPELSAAAVAAAFYPDEAQVEPQALMRALSTALVGESKRVAVKTGASVERLVVERDRCAGVLVDGDRIDADATLVAAGSWSSLVAGVPLDVPRIEPIRGQMVLLEERPPRLRRIVSCGDVYAVPRGDGRVVCGSTLEAVAFERGVTAGGVRAILDGALGLAPSLANASLVSTWSGFRPRAALPVVGATRLPGLFMATGHYRNGILLAKVTADAIAAAIVA
jgi:glycine oxidase